jgi:DNA repair exonuclease SbcCD ATPase subunit
MSVTKLTKVVKQLEVLYETIDNTKKNIHELEKERSIMRVKLEFKHMPITEFNKRWHEIDHTYKALVKKERFLQYEKNNELQERRTRELEQLIKKRVLWIKKLGEFDHCVASRTRSGGRQNCDCLKIYHRKKIIYYDMSQYGQRY